jgi:predicted component of viral defense system (DUF524 family)
VTVSCPLDCPYLQEARSREKLPDVDPRKFPNSDIRVSEDFLRRNEFLLIALAASLAKFASETTGVVDSDTRDALDSLVRTYRTLQSGLYYESRPDNVLAARLQAAVQNDLDEIRKRAAETAVSIRDADVLGVLAFLQRLEIQHNNGRPKGRAFIQFLHGFFPEAEAGDGQGLIVTE